MRATRLIQLLMLLQSRRRVTVGLLAERLQVSRRTIQRDLEALGRAGVPVATWRGLAGGVELLPGFRAPWAPLTVDETERLALCLAGRLDVVRALDLEGHEDSLRIKLLGHLPEPRREQVETLGQRFLLEPGESVEEHRHLAELAAAVRRSRSVYLRLGGDEELLFEPLVLVWWGRRWSLFCHPEDLVELDRIESLRTSSRRFDRPPELDLGPLVRSLQGSPS
ncbi:MAG: HTH domain-containing protein [Acidobacteriota bacterium]